jgi:hypothetical protein
MPIAAPKLDSPTAAAAMSSKAIMVPTLPALGRHADAARQ